MDVQENLEFLTRLQFEATLATLQGTRAAVVASSPTPMNQHLTSPELARYLSHIGSELSCMSVDKRQSAMLKIQQTLNEYRLNNYDLEVECNLTNSISKIKPETITVSSHTNTSNYKSCCYDISSVRASPVISTECTASKYADSDNLLHIVDTQPLSHGHCSLAWAHVHRMYLESELGYTHHSSFLHPDLFTHEGRMRHLMSRSVDLMSLQRSVHVLQHDSRPLIANQSLLRYPPLSLTPLPQVRNEFNTSAFDKYF